MFYERKNNNNKIIIPSKAEKRREKKKKIENKMKMNYKKSLKVVQYFRLGRGEMLTKKNGIIVLHTTMGHIMNHIVKCKKPFFK